jgi:hypothetical protein
MSVGSGRFCSQAFAYVEKQVICSQILTTDYETAALPAELRRRGAGKTLHRGKAIATAHEPRAHDRAPARDRT